LEKGDRQFDGSYDIFADENDKAMFSCPLTSRRICICYLRNRKKFNTTNQLIGLVIPKSDFLLHLICAIDIIGKSDMKSIDGKLVRYKGSEQLCKINSSLSHYCEFEQL